MWKQHRSKLFGAVAGLAVVGFVYASAMVVPAGAQEKKAEQKVKTQRKGAKKSSSRQRKQKLRRFVPKDKVSAGKPVSFPTDI